MKNSFFFKFIHCIRLCRVLRVLSSFFGSGDTEMMADKRREKMKSRYKHTQSTLWFRFRCDAKLVTKQFIPLWIGYFLSNMKPSIVGCMYDKTHM